MIYSHSRLSCFEQCPKKFELKYLQKLKVPERESIEAFMGKRVHETFEKLFNDLQHTKKDSLSDLLDYYEKDWNKEWTQDIVITKEGLTNQHYFGLGKTCITNFYEKNHPFDKGKILGIEKKIKLDLNGDGKYKLIGYIDLLMQVGKNHFQIHDYKTYSKLPEQEKMDKDEQLALYQLWLQKEFPEAKQVDLTWHYVVFQREGVSHRTAKQLEQIKNKTIRLIDKIESATCFESKAGPLCGYCSYKIACPSFKHAEELQKLPVAKYSLEEGVQLADQYVKVYKEKQELLEKLDGQLEELKAKIFDYAKQHGFEVVQGTNNKLRLKTSERAKFPAKNSKEREQLEQLIKKHNLWANLSELDTTKLAKELEEGQIDKKTANYSKKQETTRFLACQTKIG